MGGDITCSAEGSQTSRQCEVMFLGSVTRALALFHIHWCMKFLCHPRGMKLGEERGSH